MYLVRLGDAGAKGGAGKGDGDAIDDVQLLAARRQ